ncbi:hypothetical protein FHX08_002366 [Rhizobium sp. BK529]|uniref:hypothetical protein n=1 Tax=unclassified Rhizobium TaxID=2613769 RepID=UPI0010EF34E5|nr:MULTISPECIES: hypothetical protein [unclassified Rhizobium]MBB3592022.1 hypothetical protein [Rhizobium sp. BK529]TCS06445.1 hypothetical protein EV281_10248 [Rhizobium sp. BK418]
MAIVVALADRLPQSPRRTGHEPREAKILWFTGVRYERLVETPDKKPAHSAPRVKNK